MHYYQFNIGDYASHTRHLTPIEDVAYRRLLDAYYLQERPLNGSVTLVARQINLREYEVEVKAVLEEFFDLTDCGWVSNRIDKEIQHYRAKIEQASRAGKASAQRRNNDRSTDVQPTNNHKPITNIKKAPKVATPEGVPDSLWEDFLAIRKAKKLPMTETAMEGLKREAASASKSLSEVLKICCERGWGGFNAKWLERDLPTGGSKQLTMQEEMAMRARAKK